MKEEVEAERAAEPAPGAGAGIMASRLAFVLIASLFVASGLVSLIYQIVWTRILVLVFGSTTFATATVLSVFMGGLALGSFAAGRLSRGLPRPFLWYGILEGVIGVWALVVPFLFEAAVPVYKAAWLQFHLSVLPFSLLRFVMAAVILIVPTTCMGATLPLLAKFVTTRLDFVGNRVGTLYAVNTLGAVAGAVIGGFVLLPSFGLNAATILASLINFLLCGAVILVAPSLERGVRPEAEQAPPAERAGAGLRLVTRATILAFAVSGASAMVYEVGWTRTLLMVIGSSTYAFSVMLSTFLVGIFAGSLILSRYADRLKQPLAWFALIELLICLCGIVSLYQFNYLPWWNLSINEAFGHGAERALLIRFILAGLILLPLTVCFGAIFPIVVKIATRDLDSVGRSVGDLYSANTLGAIAGSFLCGFVLVPAFGVEKSLIFASVANLAVGVFLLCLVERIRGAVKAACVLMVLVAVAWSLSGGEVWDRVCVLSAQMERRRIVRQALSVSSFDEWKARVHGHFDLLYWKDGTSSTVGVLRSKPPAGQRSLVTNGHVDASDGGDMSTQVLLSAYPLIWRPQSQDVGIIGWGSGVSVGVSTLFPVSSVTAIEIEPAVFEASRWFHHVNLKPEKDRRVHLEYNDGRNYMLATDRKFDVVVSEPSNPWQAGVCNLFTREYFQIVRGRMKPGGVFSFWLQTVEIPTENLRSIFRSLAEVFPYRTAVMANPGNLVVLASDRPLTVDYKSLCWLVANTPVSSELSKLGLTSGGSICARIMASTDGVASMVHGVEPNVDDTNRLEFAVGRSYEVKFFSKENSRLIARHQGQPWKDVLFTGMKAAEQAEAMCSIAREALLAGNQAGGESWSRASLAVAPSPEAFRVLGIAALEQGRPREGFACWQEALKLDAGHVETLQTRGMALLQSGKPEEARADFLKVLDAEPDNPAALYHMAQTYGRLTPEPNLQSPLPDIQMLSRPDQKPETVLGFLRGLTAKEDFVRRHPDVLYMAAVANYQLGKLEEAETLVRRFLALKPRSVAGSRILGSILLCRGRGAEASNWWFSSYLLSRPAAEECYRQAKVLLKEGRVDAALDLFERGIELWPGDQEVYSILKTLAERNGKAARLLATLRGLNSAYQRTLVTGGH